ncbi:conserved hypothetical protein [Bradyrhizobium sp. ORS 285]|nr:conserved hypothetical protein [Bradyrhizobium sp. ORS 285]
MGRGPAAGANVAVNNGGSRGNWTGGGGNWNGGGGNWSGGGWRGGHHGGWHRGGGFWPGVGVGVGIGLGSSYAYYNDPYYYGNDYYNDYSYYDDSAPVAVIGTEGVDPSYCARRYRSYDPASGTYLGYDGLRHPCP